jgi:4,5-dihydroxyphthalate decarboxylase
MSLVPSELTQPILDGKIAPAGIEWTLTSARSVDANSRQMLSGAFDVAEMSLATFLKAFERGSDLIGLPIFTGRGFLQPAVACRQGIASPRDLAGKRVGLPQFWMTSSVWHKGILQEQHGVRPDQVQWLTEAEERFDSVEAPAGVHLERLPKGLPLKEALDRGEVDAVMVPPRGARSFGDDFSRPFADVTEAQRAYFSQTGVWPIMHFVVMRKSLHDSMPSLAPALLSAFLEAKRISAESVGLPKPLPGLQSSEQDALFGPDPWQCGLEKNRLTLETFLRFSVDQGWLGQRLPLESYFASPTS